MAPAAGRQQKSRLLLPSVETLRIRTKGESMSNRPSLVAFHGNSSDSIAEKSPVKGAGQKKLLVAGTDLQLAVAIKPYSALRHFLRISLRSHQHGWRLVDQIGARRELPVLTFPRPLGIEPSNPHASLRLNVDKRRTLEGFVY